jgi:hypothetical protein
VGLIWLSATVSADVFQTADEAQDVGGRAPHHVEERPRPFG